MRVDPDRRTLAFQVVLYGPGLSGKRTTLSALRRHAPDPSGSTGNGGHPERTFGWCPSELPELGGHRVRVELVAAPGHPFHALSRRLTLASADGLVFVADSSPGREVANLVAREALVAALAAHRQRLHQLPHVYQWNKRDLPSAVPVARLEEQLNPEGARSFEAVAASGEGVWELHRALLAQMADVLMARGGVPRR